jgi:hypothetical protein
MIRRSCAFLCSLLLLNGCVPDLSSLEDGESSEGPLNEGGAGVGGGPGVSGSAGASQGGATAGGSANPPLAGGGNGAGAPPVGGGGSGAGSGGVGGMPVTCMPMGVDDDCDGVDEDCDGVVDNDCPGGVSTTYMKDMELIGDSFGGDPFTEDCNAGEVLGGIAFAVGGFVTQLKGICYSLRLKPNANAPEGYELELFGARELAPHPTTSPDTVTTLSCSPGEAMVGLRLSQQNQDFAGTNKVITPRAWLTCARLVLTKDGEALSVKWEGAKQVGPVSGGLVNENANWFVESKAEAPFVASRLLGRTGDWVDRAGFGVSQVKVVPR